MAGDWIKMTSDVSDKPEVHQMAGILSIDPDAVVGKLFRVWAWFDKNTVDGHAFGVTFNVIDRMTFCQGFGEAMMLVGWLEQSGHEMILPKFERHNGETAKKRALGNKRKEKERSEGDKSHDDVADLSRSESDKSVTREEKKREEVKEEKKQTKKQTASGDASFSELFLTWWASYPRKDSKQAAWKVWQKKKLDSVAEDVQVKTQAVANKNGWHKDSTYCPHGSTFLNDERWRDADELIQKPVLINADEIVTYQGRSMTRAEMQAIKDKRYQEVTGYAR